MAPAKAVTEPLDNATIASIAKIDACIGMARVQGLVALLGRSDERLPLKERCAEVLAGSEEFDVDPAVHRRRAELEAAMKALEMVIHKSFI